MNLYKAIRNTQWAVYESIVLASTKQEALTLLKNKGITEFELSNISLLTNDINSCAVLSFEESNNESYEG